MAIFASCHYRMGSYFGAESGGKRAAAGPSRPALNRHRGVGRQAICAQRPITRGGDFGEPPDPSTPGSSPPASPPRATAGQPPSAAPLDFQPDAVYWLNQNAHVQVFTDPTLTLRDVLF